jgi:nicotinamidase-related amidase
MLNGVMSTSLPSLALHAGSTGLVLIDVQERLVAAMPTDVVDRAIRNWTSLLDMAGRLRCPILVTEQYPKGLGRTLPVVREILGKVMPPPRYVEKIDFSACAEPLFMESVTAVGRRTWLVAGMETHVCVMQTVRGLRERGFEVHVPRDAVVSRHKWDWRAGLGLLERMGAVVTSTETALFDLVGRAEGEHFKALSRLIR